MSYAVDCHSLGFICDYQATSSSRSSAVSALVHHINSTHGTGSTSPALSALIDGHVFQTQEYAS